MTGEASSPDAGRPSITDVLVADLEDLGAELVADENTTASIAMLRRDLRLAVRSVLGFSITLTIPGPSASVAINVVDEPLLPDRIGDVLTVQLPARHGTATASITIYAADPRALDDLRDEFAYAFDRPLTVLATGAPQQSVTPGITGLHAFGDAYQAVGVLLAIGHTTETAGIELVRRAHTTPGGIGAAARALVGSYHRGSPSPT